jgi:predicted ester cyclase
MSEQTETVVRRFLEECLTGKNMGLIDELFSPEYVNNAATPDISPDLDGYKERVGYMIAAFPDLSIEVHDLFSDGDRVAVRLTASGTHRGIYMGVVPTGERASWTAIAIYRVVDGRIVERWENRDDLGMMRHLGLVQG